MMGNGIPAGGGGVRWREIPLSSFILLRPSDHEIPLRGFHAANKILLLYLLFIFSREEPGACQALSDAIVAAGPWSTQAGQDLSLCDCVRLELRTAGSQRASGLLTFDGRDKQLHLRVEGTEQCRQSPASCVTTRRLVSRDTFHFISMKMSSGCCRSSSQSALSLPGLKCLNLACTFMQPPKPKRCFRLWTIIYSIYSSNYC